MAIDACPHPHTFTAKADYKELVDHIVILNSSHSSATIKIGIIETRDIQHEKDEEFIVNLSFPGESIPEVMLKPDNATVTIIEFDGEGITHTL